MNAALPRPSDPSRFLCCLLVPQDALQAKLDLGWRLQAPWGGSNGTHWAGTRAHPENALTHHLTTSEPECESETALSQVLCCHLYFIGDTPAWVGTTIWGSAHFSLLTNILERAFFKAVSSNVLMIEERAALQRTGAHSGCGPGSAGTVAAGDKSSSSLHYCVWLPTSITRSLLSPALAASSSLC